MGDWPLVGNGHVKEFLSKSIANKKIANTYIFLGPEDLGKTTIANYFAKLLLCQDTGKNKQLSPCDNCSSCKSFLKNINTDLHILKKNPEKKNISVEQTRELIKSLSMSSFSNSYKIGIIKQAELLNKESANALLKTLEEPNKKVVIIMIASNIEDLPKTIASRSQILNFYPAKTDVIYDYLLNEYKASRSIAKKLAHLSLGRPALAVKFFEEKDFYENYFERVNIFLDIFNKDLRKSFDKISKELKATNSQEAREIALEIILIWQSLLRDLVLLNSNNKNLVQHQEIENKLQIFAQKYNREYILKANDFLEKGKKYLQANVNSKLVLENLAINLI